MTGSTAAATMADTDISEELLQQTASQEEREDQDVIGNQDADVVVFKVITVDDVDHYECTACGKRYKAKSSVRSHITRVHEKQKDKESPIVNKEKDDAPFDMRRLNRWRSTSTQREGAKLGDATVQGLEGDFSLEEEDTREEEPDKDAEEDPDKDESVETLKLELVEVNTKLKSMTENMISLKPRPKKKPPPKSLLSKQWRQASSCWT